MAREVFVREERNDKSDGGEWCPCDAIFYKEDADSLSAELELHDNDRVVRYVPEDELEQLLAADRHAGEFIGAAAFVNDDQTQTPLERVKALILSAEFWHDSSRNLERSAAEEIERRDTEIARLKLDLEAASVHIDELADDD